MVLSFFCDHHAAAQTVQIAPMTWTPRSDWIDVTASPYNADPNGQADSTAAIISAMNAASSPLVTNLVSTAPKTVYFPPGNYKISDTLHWTTGTSGISGLSLIGCGNATTISWYGATGGVMCQASLVAKSRYIGIRWDGRNIAATGVLHNGRGKISEVPVRHFNEAFLNFTGVALNFDNNYQGVMGCWTGQAEVWNCLFYNCALGSQIGLNAGNEYEYMFEKCEFQNCGTGIDSYGNTANMVYDTHFANSTVTDMTAKLTTRVRRVTSTGSKAFFTSPPWSGACGNMHVFQDCWVDSWTNTGTGASSGALQIGDRIQAMIFDCKFTNPPNSARPINLTCTSGTRGGSNLLVSNNSYPGVSDQTAMVQTGVNGGLATVFVVPPSSPDTGITTTLSSANTVFLDSTPIADGTNILDVTKPPYNAKNDTSVDATTAIQQAITDAKNTGNGTIVYLPTGFYKISSPLAMTGSNYKLQGGGAYTRLCWNGANNSSAISVSNVDNVAVENLAITVSDTAAPLTAAIMQTSTTGGRFTVDWVYSGRWGAYYPNNSNQLLNFVSFNGGVGLKLSSLCAGSRTYIASWSGPLTLVNCGAAEIFGNHVNGGRFDMSGSSSPETGFAGFLYSNLGYVAQQGISYDVSIRNNQSCVFGDFYNEQTHNNIDLEGSGEAWEGQVAVQGFKQQCWDNSIALNIANYQGLMFYGPQNFMNSDSSGTSYIVPRIIQSGASPVDLVLPVDVFHAGAPSITMGASCNLIQAYNEWRTADYISLAMLPNVPNPLTADSFARMAEGLDLLRKLNRVALKYQYAVSGASPIFQADFNDATTAIGGTVCLNPSKKPELNPIITNSAPLGSGSYFNAVVTSATWALNTASFTPYTAANSWAALAQGTVNSGSNTVLSGGFDMLVRANSTPSNDQSWLRPIDIDNRTNGGLRIIFTGGGSGAFQFQLIAPTGVNAFSTTGTNYNINTITLGVTYPLALGTIYHLGFTFNTESTGRVTFRIFAQSGTGAIDTSGQPLVQTSFYLSAAAVAPANTFYSGTWYPSERYPTYPLSTNTDYDCFRLYDVDPGVFSVGK